MRRQLITVFVAISLMVSGGVLSPLFLQPDRRGPRHRRSATSDACRDRPRPIPDSTREQIESAGATASGRNGRLTVTTSSGWTIGPEVEHSARLDAALTAGVSAIGSVDGGVEVVTAVASGPETLSAVRVFVPDRELRRGQWAAWSALAAVAVTLVGLSVLVADRLARSIVRPAQQLATAAHRLGRGDLSTRVDPEGPPELAELAGAFNSLGAQVSTMLARERELVADLSHRLRTPLTKLRMRVDQVDDGELAAALRGDADDLTTVVNDLIAEARGSLSTAAESCDAGRVVADRVAFWSVLAEDTDRPSTFDHGSGPL
ncbi:MAG: HAMP domain-containing protein, partial [Acidimicrobiales bacterium]